MQTAAPNHYDVVIVGGGPIGLEMAVAMHKSGLTYVVVEAKQIGSTIAWWAPQTRWFSSNDRISIAGVPLESIDQTKATREQYLAYLRSVASQFKLNVQPFTQVHSVHRSDPESLIVTGCSSSRSYQVASKAVVLAVGGTDQPKHLGVPGENLPHVDSYFREPHRYFQRRVLIIGGRNSAIEAALRANQCGAYVSISYRGEYLPRESIKYWLLPEIEGLIRSGKIHAHFQTIPINISPDSVTLRRIGDPESFAEASQDWYEPFSLPADDVLSLIGYRQDKTLFRNCGINLVGESERPEFDPASMQTNVRGVFVAGTAIAGTQSSRYQVFVENCHVHVARIMASLTGSKLPLVLQQNDAVIPELRARIEAMPES